MPRIDEYDSDIVLDDNDSVLGFDAATGKTKRFLGSTLRALLGSANGVYFNVRSYGAKGDGTTDDTAAIQAAINAALATLNKSATVFFPAGTYNITAALVCTSATLSAAGNGVTLRGEGHSASIIFKAASGFAAVTWNGNGGPDANPSSYGGLVDISIEGGSTSGGLVQTNSANQMFFRGFSLNGGVDFAMDLNTMQDSYFDQWSSNSVHSASAPIVKIYGSSVGNTNQLFFSHFRIEDFYGVAIDIRQGTGNGGTNNGFYFSDMKLETGVVSGDFMVVDANTLDLHIERAFGSANSYKSGYSTPINMIKSSAYQTASYDHIYFNDGIGGQNAALAYRPNGGDFGVATARNIFYNGTGNVATIDFGSTISNMRWTILGCGTDGSGAVLGGTLPYQLVEFNNNLIGGGTITGPMRSGVSVLTDAATIATNSDLANEFTVTLGGNRTMGAPSGTPVDGQRLTYRITQPATGGPRTMAWNAIFRFCTSIASPTLSTAANKVDYVEFIYNAAATKWDVADVRLGY